MLNDSLCQVDIAGVAEKKKTDDKVKQSTTVIEHTEPKSAIERIQEWADALSGRFAATSPPPVL